MVLPLHKYLEYIADTPNIQTEAVSSLLTSLDDYLEKYPCRQTYPLETVRSVISLLNFYITNEEEECLDDNAIETTLYLLASFVKRKGEHFNYYEGVITDTTY